MCHRSRAIRGPVPPVRSARHTKRRDVVASTGASALACGLPPKHSDVNDRSVDDLWVFLRSLGFTVAGFAIAVAAAMAMRPELRFRRRAIRAKGQVVGVERRTEHRPVDFNSWGTRYFPVVEFATQRSGMVRATSSVGRKARGLMRRPPHLIPSVGKQIRIAYDPDDPTTVRWRLITGSALAHLSICVAIGVLVGVVGVVLMIDAVV
jgi:hypothetical protein